VSPATTPDRTDIDLTQDVMNQRMEINRRGSIDEQLRFAITNKLLIEVSYGGSTRTMEPHDYGLQKGSQKLLAYQVRRTGNAPSKALTGWRLLDVSKIDTCFVLEETFRGSRGEPHQRHYVWDFLYSRVA
jgi:hypothetical protein